MTALASIGAVAAFAPALSGCTGTVPMEPAPKADDPACAEIIVRLPPTLGEQQKRRTNAQATGAWGKPATILLTCGVVEPEVSSQSCVTVNDVDWLVDDTDDPTYRFTTYGRSPATELVIDSTAVSGNSVLAEISPAVQRIPATKHCH
ncbi:DUF3515 domain-containing protein [Pseudoclavibacter sp. CFCC 14310]|uniref:DUF3515 family protein n=1 Tax=Pseudoclavibacter sp. CFCC 14310 TaxID=2615180 RepID=UPI00130190A2|nr:DUF3515 family protein [Pseudoclavibacter sp. CFCC 14310]KAB1645717.1 DUF3515 domain-containing protein [Pseudoclavibacter sp. CFCC 14310]